MVRELRFFRHDRHAEMHAEHEPQLFLGSLERGAYPHDVVRQTEVPYLASLKH